MALQTLVVRALVQPVSAIAAQEPGLRGRVREKDSLEVRRYGTAAFGDARFGGNVRGNTERKVATEA